MIKDQIKIYNDFSQFKSCPFCLKTWHLPIQCPKLFFTPDRDFLIKKYIYNPSQNRKQFTHLRKRKRPNALKNLLSFQIAVLKFQAFTENAEEEPENANLNNETEKNEATELIEFRGKRGDNRRNVVIIEKEPNEQKRRTSFNLFDAKKEFLLPEVESPKISRLELISEESSPKSDKIISFPNPNINLPTLKKNSSSAEKTEEVVTFVAAEKELFLYDFEKCFNFQAYFPKNNLNAILEKNNMSPRSKILKRLKPSKMKSIMQSQRTGSLLNKT